MATMRATTAVRAGPAPAAHGATLVLASADGAALSTTAPALRRAGFWVAVAADGTEALRRWRAARADLLVLDAALPGVGDLGGVEVCRQVRAAGATPVVLLADAGDDAQVGAAFAAGASAVLPKPVGPIVLTARLDALRFRAAGGAAAPLPAVIRASGLVLDAREHEVRLDGGDGLDGPALRLTRTECRVLRLLLANAGRPVSAARLAGDADRSSGSGATDVELVKSLVSRLRRKLRLGRGGPATIEAVPGVGYRLASVTAAPPTQQWWRA